MDCDVAKKKDCRVCMNVWMSLTFLTSIVLGSLLVAQDFELLRDFSLGLGCLLIIVGVFGLLQLIITEFVEDLQWGVFNFVFVVFLVAIIIVEFTATGFLFTFVKLTHCINEPMGPNEQMRYAHAHCAGNVRLANELDSSLKETHGACCLQIALNMSIIELATFGGSTLNQKSLSAVRNLCDYFSHALHNDISCTAYSTFKSNFFGVVTPLLSTLGFVSLVIGTATLLTLVFACCLACTDEDEGKKVEMGEEHVGTTAVHTLPTPQLGALAAPVVLATAA